VFRRIYGLLSVLHSRGLFGCASLDSIEVAEDERLAGPALGFVGAPDLASAPASGAGSGLATDEDEGDVDATAVQMLAAALLQPAVRIPAVAGGLLRDGHAPPEVLSGRAEVSLQRARSAAVRLLLRVESQSG